MDGFNVKGFVTKWLVEHYLQGVNPAADIRNTRYHWFNMQCDADLKSLMAGLSVTDIVAMITDAIDTAGRVDSGSEK